MSAAACDLARHLSGLLTRSPDLAYLIGPGSRTWELMIGAVAAMTGEAKATPISAAAPRWPRPTATAAPLPCAGRPPRRTSPAGSNTISTIRT